MPQRLQFQVALVDSAGPHLVNSISLNLKDFCGFGMLITRHLRVVLDRIHDVFYVFYLQLIKNIELQA